MIYGGIFTQETSHALSEKGSFFSVFWVELYWKKNKHNTSSLYQPNAVKGVFFSHEISDLSSIWAQLRNTAHTTAQLLDLSSSLVYGR